MMPSGIGTNDPRLATLWRSSSLPHEDSNQLSLVNNALVPLTYSVTPQLPFLSETGRNELLAMLDKPEADIKSHLYVAKNFPSLLIDLLYRVALGATQRAQNEVNDNRPSKPGLGQPEDPSNGDPNSSQIQNNVQLIESRELSSNAVRLQFKPFFLFCKFIGRCPQVTTFIYSYFEKSSFQPLPSDFYYMKKTGEVVYKHPGFDDNLLIDILLSYFTYLSYDPKFFGTIWNWSGLSRIFLLHRSNDIRYLSACCLAIITKPTREQFLRFLRKHLRSQPESSSADTNLTLYQSKFSFIFDSKFEPLVETESFPAEIFTNRFPPLTIYEYYEKDLVKVVNVLLIKEKSHDQQKVPKRGEYVTVPSLQAHLSSLAYSISIGRPCLIRGPVGSGKTAILDYIASETNRAEPPSFIRVQVGDQIDSKLLIGSYVCSEIPGQFEWKPGPLALAISKGSWIVFEDIDFAPPDMLSLVHSVVENKTLESAANCPMKLNLIHPNFRIFFSQRVSAYGRKSSDMMKASLGFLERICDVIDLPPLSDEDLLTIINSRFRLEQISEKLVKIFNLAGKALSEAVVGSTRKISLRDLFKICNRLQANNCIANNTVLCQTELEAIFLDFTECLLGFLPQSLSIDVAYRVGAELNLSRSEVSRLCIERNPEIGTSEDQVQIGRVSFKVYKGKSTAQNTIAHTRHSSCLMERISSCIKSEESVLLVGETGVGKTTIVQHMANLLNIKMVVINLSQQTDSSDLMGGFKPVDICFVMQPIKQELESIFSETFSASDNEKFLGHISNCYHNKKWMQLLRLIQQLYSKATKRPLSPPLLQRWTDLQSRSDQFLKRLKLSSKRSPMALSFVEGTLMKAIKEGYWILMDEVNLAEPEVLQCLVAILDSIDKTFIHTCDPCNGPISIKKHPNFRVFACMNPSTDVGKRDLTTGIRNRFTEIYVDDILNKNDLRMIVNSYLKDSGISTSQMDQLVEFYLQVRERNNTLSDISGNFPNYSLRSLCRALHICSNNICHNIEKSLFEALRVTFLQQLNDFSKKLVTTMISKTVFSSRGDTDNLINVFIPRPKDYHNYINVEGYWIQQGSRQPDRDENYILTEAIRKNLENIARIVSLGQRRLPILLQGRTSVGKTSLITYLAKLTGNHCYRLNNHEHTDLQEYLGGFVMNDQGSIEFKDGLLTHAMKRGHWIILDELNLAPGDLLEALNRVLDDNRELFIPENRQTVKAHSRFMLFATQNPPQDYAGRKMLSRAFRNRFIELHFDDIPSNELENILSLRCEMPESYAKKIVDVMRELQILRRESGFFAGKHGFMTLRDLFRWGDRYRMFKKNFDGISFDWQKKVAEQGLTLLEGRVRTHKEAEIVRKIIERVFHRELDRTELYKASIDKNMLSKRFSHLYMTTELHQMYSQLSEALDHHEPVLLCGPTGCGKTTACQVYAEQKNVKLYIANCHLNSEGADFVGNIRPIRDKCSKQFDGSDTSSEKPLYEWVDGPLVRAMKEGAYFLIDEISLADDAVLERINSVLENERTITLSEKASADDRDVTVKALPNFRIIATMNPGGDYGKKELSPALRNRFTEIYCYNTTNLKELGQVILHNLTAELKSSTLLTNIIMVMKEFLRSFYEDYIQDTTHVNYSMRDILSWTKFINSTCSSNHPKQLSLQKALYHGATLVFIDSIGTCGSNCSALSTERNATIEYKAKNRLISLIKEEFGSEPIFINKDLTTNHSIQNQKKYINFEQFCIPMGPNQDLSCNFQFEVPGVKMNTIRIVRAMQLDRSILLEGDPGVGKTSIVSSLAKVTGHELIRINLSEQTDISDLFGSDLPVESATTADSIGENPKFGWHDGPFLQALKESKWVLLDEMNLASQSVLEGLNACLDHRGTIFIPELNKEFRIDRTHTRIFACQNPHKQGSSRKGLPQSFLNRFTSIYVKGYTSQDLNGIVRGLYPQLTDYLIAKMVEFNEKVSIGVQKERTFGLLGSPWEFNLRDLIYWCDLTTKYVIDFGVSSSAHGPIYRPSKFVQLVYLDRMRSDSDKDKIDSLFKEVFGHNVPPVPPVDIKIGDASLIIGRSFLKRKARLPPHLSELAILKFQMTYIESLAKAIEMGKMAILVGERSIGKRSMARIVAGLAGYELKILSANFEMDVVELLGSFEQKNIEREIARITDEIRQMIYNYTITYSDNTNSKRFTHIFNQCWSLQNSTSINEPTKSDLAQTSALKLNILKDLMNIVKDEKMPEKVRSDFARLRTSVEDLIQVYGKSMQSISCTGSFEWIDSVLVRSIKEGSWLMIENANLLNPSTLDRLNSLMETDGTLILNEKGANADGRIECVKPHPDFRLILTMDPINGELSRAMRNRGVEIFVEPILHREDFYRILSKNGIAPVLNRICLPTAIWETCIKIDQDYVGDNSDRRHLTKFILQFGHSLRHHICRGLPVDVALATLLHRYYSCHGFAPDSAENFDLLQKVKDIMSKAKKDICAKVDDHYIYRNQWIEFNYDLSKYTGGDAIQANIQRDLKLIDYSHNHLVTEDVVKEDEHLNYGKFVSLSAAIKIFLEQSTFDDLEARLDYLKQFFPAENHVISIITATLKYESFVPLIKTSFPGHYWPLPFSASEMNIDPRLCPEVYQILLSSNMPEMLELEKSHNCWLVSHHWLMLELLIDFIAKDSAQHTGNESLIIISEKYKGGQLDKREMLRPEIVQTISDLCLFLKDKILKNIVNRYYDNQMAAKMMHRLFWISYVICKFTAHHPKAELVAICNQIPMLWALSYQKIILPIIRDCDIKEPLSDLYNVCENLGLDASMMQPADKNLFKVAFNRFAASYSGQIDNLQRETSRFYYLLLNDAANRSFAWSNSQYLDSIYALNAKIEELHFSSTAFHPEDNRDFNDTLKKSEDVLKELKDTYKSALSQQRKDGNEIAIHSRYEQKRLLSDSIFAPLWQLHFVHRRGCAALIEEDFEDYLSILDNIISSDSGLYVSPIYHANILKFDNFLGQIDTDDMIGNREVDMNVVSTFILNHLQELRLFDIQVRYWVDSFNGRELPMPYPIVPEYSPLLSALCARNLNVQHLKFSSDIQITKHLQSFCEYLWRNFWALTCQDHDIIDLRLAEKWIISYEQMKDLQDSPSDLDYPSDHIFKSFINSRMEKSTEFFRKLDLLNQYHADAVKAIKLIVFGYNVYTICAPLYPMDPVLRMREKLEIYKSELSHLKIELALRHTNYYRRTGNSMEKDDIDLPFAAKIIYERCRRLEQKITRMQSSYTNRPQGDCGTQYKSLKLYIENFLNSIGSKDRIIDDFIERAFKIFDEERFNTDKLKQFNRSCTNLLKTIQNCIDHLKSSFSLFTDLTTNFLTGMGFTLQGLKLLRVCLDGIIRAREKGFRTESEIEHHITHIIRVSGANAIESARHLILNQSKIHSLCSPENVMMTRSNLFKIVLYQLNNQIMVSPHDVFECLPSLIEMLSQFHSSWLEDLRHKEELREKGEALYQFKPARSTLNSDDPYNNREFVGICTTFPTYDHCYRDLHGEGGLHIQAELTNMITEEKIDKHNLSVDLTDCIDICRAHLKFIQVATKNLLNYCSPDNFKNIALKEHSRHKILEFKSQIFSELLRDNILALSHKFDSKFLDFFITQSATLVSLLDESKDPDTDNYDIYHNSNPKEVRRLQDFFDLLHDKIKELRKEFPDHILLASIVKLMDRIGSFLITDPLMKFITGSHSLLEEIESWNTQVPAASKLTKEEASLNEIIALWRRLEMQSWGKSLVRVEKKMEDESLCHLWFNLYTAYAKPKECAQTILGAQYDEELDLSEEGKILIGFSTFLIQFMDASKVGDYQVRLELLFAFTVQTRLIQLSCKTNYPFDCNKLIAISYNIYCLYSVTFSDCKNLIKQESTKLTKELNEAITIVVWRGRRHWEIRNNLRNAQRKINRVITKYQTYLKQEVVDAFPSLFQSDGQLSPISGENSTCSESVSHMIIGTSLLIKGTCSNISDDERDYLSNLKLFKLSKSVPITEKFIILSRQIVDAINPKYPESIYQLEEASDDLSHNIANYCKQNIESITLLNNDTKDVTAQKKKQIGQMLNTRRFILTSVFKRLDSLGLSYRFGLKFENEYQTVMASVTPLGSMLLNPGSQTLESANKAINLKLVEDCNNLYYQMMALNIKLITQCQSGSSMDPNLVERFLGYTIHLIWDICKHHKAASESYMHMLNIQSIIVRLESLEANSRSSSPLPLLGFTETHSIVTKLDRISTISLSHLKDLSTILASFRMPENNMSETMILKSLSSDSTNKQFLDEEQVKTLVTMIESKSDDLFRIKLQVQGMMKHSRKNHLYSVDDVNELMMLVVNQNNHLISIRDVIMLNDLIRSSVESTTTVLRDIILVTEESSYLQSQVNQLVSKISHDDETIPNMWLAKNIDKLVKKLMFIMQNILKYENSEKMSPSEKPIKQIDPIKMLRHLQLGSINHLLDSNIDTINDTFAYSDFKPLIKGLTPLLSIYNKNVTSYMSIILSSLYTKTSLACKMIHFFADILQKGLGTPMLCDGQDIQHNGEKLVDLTDGGFGEGQGIDDVSKRLEFESQLDELKGKIDEDSGDNKDNKDAHEDGVEMSEDFEGKAHGADAERGDKVPPEDQGDDEENLSDLEKQMDEVNQDDEVLDDNVWGHQDESEEEQLRSAPDEQGKQQSNESEIVAKDSNKENESLPNGRDELKRVDEDENRESVTINEDDVPIPPSDPTMNDDYENEEIDKGDKRPEDSNPLKSPENQLSDMRFLFDDFSESPKLTEQNEKSKPESAEAEVDKNTEDQETEMDMDKGGDEEVRMDENQSEFEEGEVKSPDELEPTQSTANEENKEDGESPSNHQNLDQSASVDDEFIERELDEALGSWPKNQVSEQPEQLQASANNKDNQPSARESGGNLFYDVYPEKDDDTLLEDMLMNNEETSADKGEYRRDLEPTRQQDDVASLEEDHLTRTSGKRVQDDSPGTNDKVNKRQKILESEKDSERSSKEKILNEKSNSQVFRHIGNKDDGTTDMIDIVQDDDIPNLKDLRDDSNKEQDQSKKYESNHREKLSDKKSNSNDCQRDSRNSVPHLSRVEKLKQNERDKESITSDDTEEGEIKSIHQSITDIDTKFTTNYGLLKLISARSDSPEWLQLLGEHNKDRQNDENIMETDDTTGKFEEVDKAASLGWTECSRSVDSLVFQLCEQLQIVLQPTKMSKYKGDYRSGKRLNIRKIVPYIASKYRKDKIWLRRTKPSKRTYQIAIAVDDSRSMSENNCRLMAFQSLALLARSLSLIEAGSLSILSFGEIVKNLHDSSEPFTDSHGYNLLKQLTFKQKKTRYAHLLHECSEMFSRCAQQVSSNQGQISQLLVIISDGRNVLQEGDTEVLMSLKKLKSSGVLTMFIIVDDNHSQQSILDIKRASFDPITKQVQMMSYMEVFPFPFYVILRQVEYMPSVLGEGLRQWFELVSNS